MRQATKAAVDALRAEYRPIYQATYGEYQEACSQLLTRQQGERDQLKPMWAARHEDRLQALQQPKVDLQQGQGRMRKLE